jgi:DNA polymerase-3 subunit gamma/tau
MPPKAALLTPAPFQVTIRKEGEMSQVLYRKWRSRNFDELIGQDHVVRTLKNAIKSGKIAHAYLFAGPRGTGKTTTARILAKAVNCLSTDQDKPCNRCEICTAINEGRCLDLIEIDAASNRGIDEIRDLREKVGFMPTQARYKVYVIDEVHMLTPEAFNALLKTLEEPPPHVIFVLATTAPDRIPPTVLSRCQRFDFRRIPAKDIIERLSYIASQEGISVEPEALSFIAHQAMGSMRDALSLLDQLRAFGEEKITLELARAITGAISQETIAELVGLLVRGQTAELIAYLDELIERGAEPKQLLQELINYLRNILLIKVSGDKASLDLPKEAIERMKDYSALLPTGQWIKIIRLLSRTALEMRGGLSPQLALEMAFLEIMEAASAPQAQETPQQSPPKETPQPLKEAIQPAQEASPAPQQPKAEELALLRAQWANLLAAIRSVDKALEALLRDCEPVSVLENTVTLGFYYPLHREKAEEDKRRRTLEEALSKLLGRPIRVKCVVIPKKKAQPTTPKLPPAEDPVVKVAVEKLGARIVGIRQEKGGEHVQKESP